MQQIRRKLFSFVLFLLVVQIIGINSNGLETSGNNDVESIIISNSLYDSAPRDTYNIEQLKLEGDQLQVNITYGGGCENHTFRLIGSDEYAESYPVQTSVLLSHDANDDPCEALLGETLVFTLLPLAQRYRELYRVNSDVITIHLTGGSEGKSLNYNFDITDISSPEDQVTSLETWIFSISVVILVKNRKRKKHQ